MPTEYFLDYNRGNDTTGDGLSPETAWKSLSKIAGVTAAAAGDCFLLADDSVWDLAIASRVVPPTTWLGTRRKPVTIGKYSPSSQSAGNKPTIRWGKDIAAGEWTYSAPLNGWTWSYGSAHVNRAMLVRLGGTWVGNAIDQTAGDPVASIDGRWNVSADSTTLILYAPAGTNPTDYYGSVRVSSEAQGAITLSSGRKWITVQDLHFEDTGAGILMYSADALEAGFVAERISGRRVSGLISVGSAAGGNLRAWVRECEIDDFGSVGIHVNSTGGAGMAFVEVYNNRIRNGGRSWAQAGIYIQSRNAAREIITFVHHNEISGYRWGTRDKAQDGSGIYAETGADGVLIAGNVVRDQYCAYQDNSGRRITWTGNVAYNCRVGMRVSDQSNNNLSDHRSYNNTFLVGDTRQVPSEWGSTQGQEYPGYWMYRTTGTGISVTAKNNIIANVGSGTARAAFGLSDVASTMTLDGNWLYGFDNDTLVASTNATPGNLSALGRGDPLAYLNADGSLKFPHLLDGIPVIHPLGRAGAYVQGVTLRNGRSIPGQTPIGAYAEGRY